jgi:hypothetical protein
MPSSSAAREKLSCRPAASKVSKALVLGIFRRKSQLLPFCSWARAARLMSQARTNHRSRCRHHAPPASEVTEKFTARLWNSRFFFLPRSSTPHTQKRQTLAACLAANRRDAPGRLRTRHCATGWGGNPLPIRRKPDVESTAPPNGCPVIWPVIARPGIGGSGSVNSSTTIA